MELKELKDEAKFMAKLIVVSGQNLPYFGLVEQVLDGIKVTRPNRKSFFKIQKTLKSQGIKKNSIISAKAEEVRYLKMKPPLEVTEEDVINAVSYLTGKKILSYEEAQKAKVDEIIKELAAK